MRIIVTILFISLLASCSESNNSGTEAPVPASAAIVENAPLDGIVWQLSSYKNTNGEIISITPNNDFSLVFEDLINEDIVIGYIGCHSLFARYSIAGEIISITVEQITTNNCDVASQNLNEFENFYLNSITSIISYSIEGNVLTIQSSDTTVLVFEKLE